MALNSKQLKAIELLVYQPYMTQKMVASECGVHRETLRRWKQEEEFKTELDKAIKERWNDAEAMAVNGMIALASEGNFQAIKYMLDNMNYKPEEKSKITVDGTITNKIVINLEDDEE